METSVFLAQFWGLYLLTMAFLFLFRRKSLNLLIELMEDKRSVMVLGFISLFIGLVSVLIHNIWVADWRVIITIFGWIALLKGITLLGWPENPKNKNLAAKMLNKFYFWLYFIFLLLVGAFLLYMGFL